MDGGDGAIYHSCGREVASVPVVSSRHRRSGFDGDYSHKNWLLRQISLTVPATAADGGIQFAPCKVEE